MQPKLSVITVNRNNAEGLKNTIISVVNQTFKNYEFIIIDGGSTDNSVDIIKEYADKITYWVSEPDRGIFHGMNKGIARAQGKYVIFMNSGDCFFSENTVAAVFAGNLAADIIAGNAMMEAKRYRLKKRLPAKITFYYFFRRNSLCHQATFIKKTLFDEVGLYDETLRMQGDWKFFLLATARYNKKIDTVNEYIALRQPDGITDLKMWSELRNREIYDTLMQHFPFFYDDYCRFHRLDKYSWRGLWRFVKRTVQSVMVRTLN
ncbi:MAG: glycosyltransferase [Cytophagaceae bacterium]|jgi:glycosyltransferase involved in cell wall biosynthesis|nr:glycosyltransferase [Cytophagaceae bacterium]